MLVGEFTFCDPHHTDASSANFSPQMYLHSAVEKIPKAMPFNFYVPAGQRLLSSVTLLGSTSETISFNSASSVLLLHNHGCPKCAVLSSLDIFWYQKRFDKNSVVSPRPYWSNSLEPVFWVLLTLYHFASWWRRQYFAGMFITPINFRWRRARHPLRV